jgi:hypothetical protein
MQRQQREGRVLCVEEHFVPHGEAHAVPPVLVELRLAPVLLLLQQHQHLGRYAPHHVIHVRNNGLTWAG